MRIDDEDEAIDALSDALSRRRAMVLTGAGVSTDSGIPDYRGPTTKHVVRSPILHADFVASEATRRRYWARSLVGYPRFRAAEPNDSHRALVCLEDAGRLAGPVTQNVDSLHGRAGSRDVVELHGSLDRVRCLSCDANFSRDALQERLANANPGFTEVGELRADGDAEIDASRLTTFRNPICDACGGTVTPDVVFFGGSVPRERSARAFARLDACDALLVVGSTLTVYSGYRFARRAHETGKPVYLLTIGETRADAFASLRLDLPILPVLRGVAERLSGT